MIDQAALLFKTVLFRPYVFAFLAIYLAAASLKLGVRKTALFTLSAWAFAYVSEFSSIRNGIPFGLYHYIPSTVGKELWVFGVPFMDSLSFTFLAYASWTTARVFLSPSEGGGLFFRLREGRGGDRFSFGVVLLGAILFMLLDVVIDPLALRGDRWFLGRIYYYPEAGLYFGVTIKNFIGWFVVGFVTLTLWGAIDRAMPVRQQVEFPGVDLIGPALYYIVLLFNLYMTFHIGEYALGWAGIFISLPVTALLVARLARPDASRP